MRKKGERRAKHAFNNIPINQSIKLRVGYIGGYLINQTVKYRRTSMRMKGIVYCVGG
jgi:hypothetical protein